MDYGKYQQLGLYHHNEESYDKVKEAFESGQNVVGIVHATGTGKTYNALQLALDNKDMNITFVLPAHSIKEHIQEVLKNNPNIDLKRDYPNLKFKTYQYIATLNEEEIKQYQCDLLILDEFHHIGAPVWGKKIETLIKTHPDMKIFGMTAYTVRDRGTQYERDMANPNTDELFSNKIVSRYDLCNALIDGILPKPVYKTAHINLRDELDELEYKIINRDNLTKEEKIEMLKTLADLKKRVHEAPSIPKLLKSNLKPNGKYIYFCPPGPENGVNDINAIKNKIINYIKQFIPEEDIIVYTSTSDMGIEGKRNRDAFYYDKTVDGEKVDNKFRIMFAINQYNEGVHAPNIDGVIMGRGTSSDIVFYEQLGRALNVRGNTREKYEELERYPFDYLVYLCNRKEIPVKEKSTKEDIIESLLAPVIIDLTNNVKYIKELENNLKDRLKEVEEKGNSIPRNVKLRNASFDITVENEDLFLSLQSIRNKINNNWELFYSLAKVFCDKYGTLDLILPDFKTNDGISYSPYGYELGRFVFEQCKLYNSGELSLDKKEKIDLLNVTTPWDEYYNISCVYFMYHGNVDISETYCTFDGVDESFDGGFELGKWLKNQIDSFKQGKLTKKQIQKLNKININWTKDYKIEQWEKMYELAKNHYNFYGNLNIKNIWYTNDGIHETSKEDGVNLGHWLYQQKINYIGKPKTVHPEFNQLSDYQIKKLEDIGMEWFTQKSDEKYQREPIKDDRTSFYAGRNAERKKVELRSRLLSLLNNYEGNSLPSKDQIQEDFINQLDSYKQRK